MNKQIGIKIVLGIIFTFLQNGNLEAKYKIKQSVFFNGAEGRAHLSAPFRSPRPSHRENHRQ